MIFHVFSWALIISRVVNSMGECPVHFCNGTHPSQSEVQNFCKNETSPSYMSGRCCIVNGTEEVVGLDLSSCGIKSLNISEDNNFTDVVIMDLRDNELTSLVPKDLIGLLNLTYLYLPKSLDCPGGKEAWNTTDHNTTSCFWQNDPCDYLQISCTINGDCIHTGPGSARCVCKPGHYGYKCMNEGEFPAVGFSVSVTAVSVFLSVMLWFALGRDAYRWNGYTSTF